MTSNATFLPVIGNEPRVAAKAFAMKPGQRSDTLQVANGVVWVQMEEKKAADATSFKTAEPQIRAEMLQKHLTEWLETKKKTVTIEIVRPDLREPRPSPFKTVTMSTGG
jgi:parvulin-like peptidyl-prolyl isomerase